MVWLLVSGHGSLIKHCLRSALPSVSFDSAATDQEVVRIHDQESGFVHLLRVSKFPQFSKNRFPNNHEQSHSSLVHIIEYSLTVSEA